VNHIRSSEIAAAEDYLSKLVDPFELMLLTAEPDDEPVTEDDRRAFEAAEARARHGEPGIPHEEILREFGITASDLR